MACLQRIVCKDVFSEISNVDVLRFTTSKRFGNDVVRQYLQHLLEKQDSRLQMYCEPYGTIYRLFSELIVLQNIPLFYKYVNLPTSDYYYSNAVLISGQTDTLSQMNFHSKSDIVLLIYQHLEQLVDKKKKAERMCLNTFERVEGCYELVPAALADKILENSDIKIISNYLEKLFKPCFMGGKLEWMSTPVIRMYQDVFGDWFFAREVELAVKAAFKEHYPGETLPEDWNQQSKIVLNLQKNSGFIRLDNEEDKALGVLHVVEFAKLEELLESLKLKLEHLNIIRFADEVTSNQALHFPLISPYGSHCRLAIHTLNELIKSLTMDLRVFQRVTPSNLPKVTDWLNSLEILFDEKRDYPFMVESWKIDEIKEKASTKLKRFFTESVYNIPVKPSFTMREVMDELNRFSPALNIKNHVLTHLDGTSSDSEYSYHAVCDAFLWGTIEHFQHDEKFQRFFDYQSGKNNIKPDNSKKNNMEMVIMDYLKTLNMNSDEIQTIEVEKMKGYLSKEEGELLEEVFGKMENLKEFEKVFDIKIDNGIYTIQRKSSKILIDLIIENIEKERELNGKVEKLENDQQLKEKEIKRLNKQIADTVKQSIEKIRKSKAESEEGIQELQNELETAMKNLEEAQKNSTEQVATVKQGYREELSKLKEELAAKEGKNQKLQEELKESRGELRKEREKNNKLADEELKNATKSMERMKKELENLKYWKTSKSKEIAELEKKNESLKTQLEIAESKIPGTSNEEHVEELEGEKNKEEMINLLLARNEKLNADLQKMTEKCEELERRQL